MKRMLSIRVICLLLVTLLVTSTSGLAATAGGGEIVDGRFAETRHITVEVYERGNDGGSAPEDNFYTNFIKEGMLRDHNVAVTFKPVPRFPEEDHINNLLAAGDAPDICVTYNYPTVQTYANMGGVLDMTPYLEQYKEMLPNLFGLLTQDNIDWNKIPETGEIWAIEARLFRNPRQSTFVREDWLKALNLEPPTTLEAFEAMLYAFQENAATLLGEDAARMIPFSTSFDVSWRAGHLLDSFVPDDFTDKDAYIYGFDDRNLLYPNYKEGVRKLNAWYNAGLVWKDFALYGAGDKTEDNLIKSGYVGAFIHNWDYPYREGEEGIHSNLKKLVGEDAAFIAIEAFQNDVGEYRKFLANPIDRKIFFPATNKEPVASLLYLDWISKLENRVFLQIGEEGVTHEVMPDGAVKLLAVTGEKIMNSPNNIDYTITINGLDLGDADKNTKSIALGYSGVDARFIQQALNASVHDGRIMKHYNAGVIMAEEGQGPALKEKRDVMLNQAVTAKPEDFDAVYDGAFQDYLNSAGQAIIDERRAAFDIYFE